MASVPFRGATAWVPFRESAEFPECHDGIRYNDRRRRVSPAPMNIGSISSLNAASLAESRANQSLAAKQRLVNEYLSTQQPSGPAGTGASAADQSQVRDKFDAFVGQTFYSQMLHEMHKTVGKAHYFNGGRAEEA